MKVVWICHFSNAEIQKILHPGISANEFAPWITQLAGLLEKEEQIELHIVAPHDHILGYKHFVLRNINYHFFNPHIIFFGKKITGIKNLDYRTNFLYTKLVIRKIVRKINPELIHLHGAENAYYSSSIFQFKKKFPIFISVQGFISHTSQKVDYHIKKRINVEKKILSNFKHFGYRTQTMGKDIKEFNPRATLHWHHYPFPDIKTFGLKKIYDLVFFARVSKDKGIEDLLQAVAILKKQKPNISLCVIGGANSEYINFLKKMAIQLNVSDNIKWVGFLLKQKDVHKLAASARISVLPTYHDIISGTIIESLFLKLPVVAYNVGSIHEVNTLDSKYIQLVEKGNVNELAMKIQELLSKPKQYLDDLGQRGFQRAKNLFNNDSIFHDLSKAYLEIKQDFNSSNISPCNSTN